MSSMFPAGKTCRAQGCGVQVPVHRGQLGEAEGEREEVTAVCNSGPRGVPAVLPLRAREWWARELSGTPYLLWHLGPGPRTKVSGQVLRGESWVR